MMEIDNMTSFELEYITFDNKIHKIVFYDEKTLEYFIEQRKQTFKSYRVNLMCI